MPKTLKKNKPGDPETTFAVEGKTQELHKDQTNAEEELLLQDVQVADVPNDITEDVPGPIIPPAAEKLYTEEQKEEIAVTAQKEKAKRARTTRKTLSPEDLVDLRSRIEESNAKLHTRHDKIESRIEQLINQDLPTIFAKQLAERLTALPPIPQAQVLEHEYIADQHQRDDRLKRLAPKEPEYYDLPPVKYNKRGENSGLLKPMSLKQIQGHTGGYPNIPEHGKFILNWT